MIIKNTKNSYLQRLLNYVAFKKNYVKITENKIFEISSANNFKNLWQNYAETEKILFVLTVKYTPVNTLLQVSDVSGRVYYYNSAGHFFKGKQKTARLLVLKKIMGKLFLRLSYLQSKPIALHFINVFNKNWLIKYFKKKLFVAEIKSFNSFPHNGCRNKKIKRKKFKKKLRI